MNKLFSFSLVILCQIAMHGQSQSSLQDQLDEIDSLFMAFDNTNTRQAIVSLVESGIISDTSHLHRKLQLKLAETLERDNENETAMQRLVNLARISLNENDYAIYAQAHLAMARLHEKINEAEYCLDHLDNALKTIKQHDLSKLYPRWANRKASYFRVFTSARDSALILAERALELASTHKNDNDILTSHLLLGLLNAAENPSLAIRHYRYAKDQWQKDGDLSGESAMSMNIAKILVTQGQLDSALIYLDDGIEIAKRAKERGNPIGGAKAKILQQKGHIYMLQQKYDSAFFYIQKGYKEEISSIEDLRKQTVIKIENEYNKERNEKQIAAQVNQLSQRQLQRNLYFIGLLSALTLIGVLLYLYMRLSKANKKNSKQQSILEEKNRNLQASLDQQIVLQAELHHRVKNNLQVIIGLLHRQFPKLKSTSDKDIFVGLKNRIEGISTIHETLYSQTETQYLSAEQFIKNLVEHLIVLSESHISVRYDMDTANARFNQDTLMPLGMIVHEVVTNGLKYARIDDNQLDIQLSLFREDEGYRLHYRDNGPGFILGEWQERDSGMGHYLLRSMVRQLGGTWESFNDHGAVITIFFKPRKPARGVE